VIYAHQLDSLDTHFFDRHDQGINEGTQLIERGVKQHDADRQIWR
jgi:hypothetical protein